MEAMGLFLASCSLELIALGIIILTSVYLYFRSAYGFWKKRGVKYVEPTVPFGNISGIVWRTKSRAEVLNDVYNSFPEEPYVGMFEFAEPFLLLRDPEVIRKILVKDFSSFMNRGLRLIEKNNPLSVHLLALEGSQWKNLRSALSPIFTSGKMKMMFPLMNECADQLQAYLDKPACTEEILDMKDIMAKFTTDIIGSCVFGLQFNALKDENSEFRKMGKKVVEPSTYTFFKGLFNQLMPSVFDFLGLQVLPDDVISFFLGAVRDTIEYREKNNVIRNDFIQQLIQLKNKGKIDYDTNSAEENSFNDISKEGVNGTNKDELDVTDSLLAAQAFIFYLAGFETSSTALSFTLYELALNPDIQTKLRKSIQTNSINDGEKITYDSLQNNSYLNMVIDESLRKYPPAIQLIRDTTIDYTVPGTSLKLKKGQKIFIPIYSLHRDSKYFPEPEKFNPENFSEEAKAARPHYTYLPFGEGPRNCIGLRFGLLQAKLGLTTLLSNYEFSVCDKTAVPLKIDPKQMVVLNTPGIWLRIKKLKSN